MRFQVSENSADYRWLAPGYYEHKWGAGQASRTVRHSGVIDTPGHFLYNTIHDENYSDIFQ